jgi:Rod binding domain-containing protein
MEQISLKIDNPQKQLQKMTETTSRYDTKQKEKIASATKQFESLLTSMMMKSMNKTTSGGMFGEEGYGNDMFDTVFEQEVGSYLSQSRSLGIAEVLYKRITGEEMTTEMRTKVSNRLNGIKMNNTETSSDSLKLNPSEGAINRINKFEQHIDDAAQSYGVDKNLIKSVIMTESAGNSKAVSSAKAKGLMQLMDSTATDMGVKNVFNPKENINGGTKYLAQMLRQYDGNVKLALAAYNAGPSNVQRFNGVPPFDETKNYINKVLGYLNHFNKENEI